MKEVLTTDIEKAGTRSLVILPLIIAAALFIYKSNAALKVLLATWGSRTLAGKPGVVAFGEHASAISAFDRSINYFSLIWPALTFGILIAAAVRAFVSPRWFTRLLGQKSMKAQLGAGLAGAPLMLCSCCVSPVFSSIAETSARLAPALGLMLAAPSLNPASLTLTFLLFDPKIAGVRLLSALTAVLLVGPFVERFVQRERAIGVQDLAIADKAIEGNPISLFLRSIATVALRTVPGVILGVVASMLIVQYLPAHLFDAPGVKQAAILITATIAVPLAMPTFVEIPLSLGLLAAGFPAGAAVALLFAGPAVNLPSLWSVARVSGWKVALAVAGSIWAIAVLAGLII